MNRILIISILSMLCGSAVAQENGLLHQWIFNQENTTGSVIKDLVGNADAELKGKLIFDQADNIQYIRLDGEDNFVEVTDDYTKIEMPQKAFTIESWAMIKKVTSDAAVLTVLQDHGEFEQGWGLCFSGSRVKFLLATEETNDGDGNMIKIAAPVERGLWYHLVGVYDGDEMRLYIDGELKACSKDPGGNIHYPENAVVHIGTYTDDNEFHPFRGSIYNVNLYSEALCEAQIKKQFSIHKALKAEEKEPLLPREFLVAPYVQNVNQTEGTIMWETTVNGSSIVEFGGNNKLGEQVRDNENKLMHEIRLTGLKPNSYYFYRVKSELLNDTIRSEMYSFKTAASQDKPFSFVALGDTQSDPAIWSKISKAVFGEHPEFILNAGDIVDAGNIKDYWVNEYFKPAQELLSYIPMFNVMGNHDLNHDYFYQYCANNGNERYYSYKWANAEFFAIDNNGFSVNNSSEQYKWLEESLKNSSAQWKFVICHQPPYSSDSDDYGVDEDVTVFRGEEEMQDMCRLFEKYEVDVVFNGHIHGYERTWPLTENKVDLKNGVRYVVTGGAGGKLEEIAPNHSWFTQKVAREHHYCLINVFENQLYFKAYDIDGRLFDSFEVYK